MNPHTPATYEVNASLLVDLGAGAPVKMATIGIEVPHTLTVDDGHPTAIIHWDDVPLTLKSQLATALHDAADQLDALA